MSLVFDTLPKTRERKSGTCISGMAGCASRRLHTWKAHELWALRMICAGAVATFTTDTGQVRSFRGRCKAVDALQTDDMA